MSGREEKCMLLVRKFEGQRLRMLLVRKFEGQRLLLKQILKN
jgi:hypothetical protein